MKILVLMVSICVVFGTLGVMGLEHINTMEGRLDKTNKKVLKLSENLAKAKDGISDLKEDLYKAENSLEFARSELQKLKEGDRYNLHDPTYEEVRQFIKEDKTDKNEYIGGKYVCVDFAADLNKQALERGIRCAAVNLRFVNKAHEIAAFETVDRGIIYVEPQYDIIIPNLRVGQEYWDVVNKYSLEVRFEEIPDDTIRRIVIFW